MIELRLTLEQLEALTVALEHAHAHEEVDLTAEEFAELHELLMLVAHDDAPRRL